MHGTKQYFKKISIIVLVVLGTLPQASSYAATLGNYAEMGLALASIPLDIAAHAQDVNQNNHVAIPLHCMVNTVNLLNKSLFFYNDTNRNSISRDRMVNGALFYYNLVKLCKNIHHAIIDRLEPLDQEILDIENEQKIATLTHTWRIVGVPCLKGLAAFLLACSQENVTDYSSRQARVMLTATHSFFTLLDEYLQLAPNSSYKNMVYVALLSNAAWLAYESAKMVNDVSLPKKELNASREDLREILNTRFGGITCVRGHGVEKLTHADIQALEKNLEDHLTQRGFSYIRSTGYYNGGCIPNSYIILDIQEQEMVALAQRFAQNSVVTFNRGTARLLHLRGPQSNFFHVANSWDEISGTSHDCTAVQATDGDFRFTYNFDFDRLLPVS